MPVDVTETLLWDVANCEALGYRRMLAEQLAQRLHVTVEEALEKAYRTHPELGGSKLARAAEKARKEKAKPEPAKHWQDK